MTVGFGGVAGRPQGVHHQTWGVGDGLRVERPQRPPRVNRPAHPRRHHINPVALRWGLHERDAGRPVGAEFG